MKIKLKLGGDKPSIASTKSRKALGAYGDGIAVDWDNLGIEDMTDAIKVERKAEDNDAARIKKLEARLKTIKDDISWHEAKLLVDIKKKNADPTSSQDSLEKAVVDIDTLKAKIKSLKRTYNEVHLELYGKTFYTTVSSVKLGKKTKTLRVKIKKVLK